jgi:DNA-binding transcriptional LysR family regulator
MTTNPPSRIRLRRYVRHGMLPQLAALEAVVRLGSATRAAEALCIAQPTLSGQLRKLSDALGVRLFETQGKRLVPTGAALTVLRAAHEVSFALERCEEALAAQRSGPSDVPVETVRDRTPEHADRARWSDAPLPDILLHRAERVVVTDPA